MKTKLLFWSAVLFLALGFSTGDGALFFFFAIHFFMLFIGVFVHTQAYKSRSSRVTEPLPRGSSTKK